MEYSPVLSICTAALEIGAAVWILRGPGRKRIMQTTAAILFLLAGYQLVEAVFCTGLLPTTGSLLPRLAFVVVAWLPPTGLLLVARLFPTQRLMLVRFSYFMYIFCTALVLAIAVQPGFVTESVCMVVFARYTTPTPLYNLYGMFYQFGLMSMLFLSSYGVTICDDRRQRLLLGQVLLGSLSFIIPALVTISVLPIAENALPSILCHFALFLAIFLVRLAVIERRWEATPGMETPFPVETLGTGSA